MQAKEAEESDAPTVIATEAAWKKIVEHIHGDDWTNQVDAMFLDVDPMKKGCSPKELARGLSDFFGIFLTSKELDGLFIAMDGDGSGTLDLDELKSAINQRSRLAEEAVGLQLAQTRASLMGARGRSLDECFMSNSIWIKIIERALQDGWRETVDAIFETFGDEEGDSIELDASELAVALNSLGVVDVPREALLTFRDDLDSDGNGLVSKDEFSVAVRMRWRLQMNKDDPVRIAADKAWSRILKSAMENPDEFIDRVRSLFETMDTDGSGDIDSTELTEGLKALGIILSGAEVAALLDDVDESGDGCISLAEFEMAMMTRKALVPSLTAGDAASSKKERALLEAAWATVLNAARVNPHLFDRSVASMRSAAVDGQTLDVVELGRWLKVLVGSELPPDQLAALRNDFNVSLDDGSVRFNHVVDAVVYKRSRQVAAVNEDPVAKGIEEAWTAVLNVAVQDSAGWASRVEQLFCDADDDGSSEMDAGEAGQLLAQLGVKLSPAQLDAFRADLDANGDGTVRPTYRISTGSLSTSLTLPIINTRADKPRGVFGRHSIAAAIPRRRPESAQGADEKDPEFGRDRCGQPA
jgi:Ca2+-binding EF-hand superfamily protein